MKKYIFWLGSVVLVLCSCVAGRAAQVLMVADEFPAMETLAAKLKAEIGRDCTIVAQDRLPAELGGFEAVMVYLHRELRAPTEAALIRYTRAGGKLIVLHHSISSGKRANRDWFPFLGVSLPSGDVSQGGYKWIEPVTLEVVNLAPDHFITTNRVRYPVGVAWASPEAASEERVLPGFVLKDSEVYLYHHLLGEHAELLGFRYTDPKTGRVYCQMHAGWVRQAEKGWIIYLMPGHSARDFEDPAYAQIVANAVVWTPARPPQN